MASKISQSEKDKYHNFTYDLIHMWNLRNKRKKQMTIGEGKEK